MDMDTVCMHALCRVVGNLYFLGQFYGTVKPLLIQPSEAGRV
jgi:hypothetical protein